MKKLIFNNKVLNVGDFLTDEMNVEEGIIVGIKFPEVFVSDKKEGWTVSFENDNMGLLEWQ